MRYVIQRWREVPLENFDDSTAGARIVRPVPPEIVIVRDEGLAGVSGVHKGPARQAGTSRATRCCWERADRSGEFPLEVAKKSFASLTNFFKQFRVSISPFSYSFSFNARFLPSLYSMPGMVVSTPGQELPATISTECPMPVSTARHFSISRETPSMSPAL